MNPESKEQRWLRIQLRLVPVALALAIVLMIVALALSVSSLLALDNLRSDEDRLEAAQSQARQNQARIVKQSLRQCERVQRLRDSVNFLNGTVYRVLKSASASNSTAREQYQDIIARVQYLPPTDCPAVVARPDRYRPPRPIPYSEYLKSGVP